jgi:hypothetical protein
MKSLTIRWMIAVAALAAAASSASAQTYKAEIPMAFRAGNAQMAPGSYDFVLLLSGSGHATIQIRDRHGNHSAFVVPFQGSDATKAWREEGKPKISFDCVGNTCSLRKLWDGHDTFAYELPARKLAPAEVERIASVTLTLTRAD